MTDLGCTPSQTVGPYLAIVLPWDDGPDVVADGTAGALIVTGRLLDGAGEPVPDGLIETWQADPNGRFDHPDDPRGAVAAAGFRGFGRCPTDADGRYWLRIVKPGALPSSAGPDEAPHLDVSVFSRGLLNRVITRMYFPDEAAANARDPLLSSLDADAGRRLVATAADDGVLHFDIRLQGADETPFFRI